MRGCLQVLDDPNWPETWPFTEQDFSRFDPSSDAVFYDSPRFVTHIDDGAISALTKWAHCWIACIYLHTTATAGSWA
jgi:hypothetical protein